MSENQRTWYHWRTLMHTILEPSTKIFLESFAWMERFESSKSCNCETIVHIFGSRGTIGSFSFMICLFSPSAMRRRRVRQWYHFCGWMSLSGVSLSKTCSESLLDKLFNYSLPQIWSCWRTLKSVTKQPSNSNTVNTPGSTKTSEAGRCPAKDAIVDLFDVNIEIQWGNFDNYLR